MSTANQDGIYIANLLHSILPNHNVTWSNAMHTIDSAKLEVPPGKQADKLRALLKLNFALQKVVTAQNDPAVSRDDFQALAEEYFFKLNFQIADINPLLLFDYLLVIGRPVAGVLSAEKTPKIVSYEFLQRYSEEILSKSISNHIDPELLNQKQNKLREVIAEGLLNEIKYVMRYERISVKKRQEEIRSFITEWLPTTEDIELIAKFANQLNKDSEIQNFFSRNGVSMFALQHSGQADEILDIMKKRVIELAIHKNDEKTFQQLVLPKTEVNQLLHYPEKTTHLTLSEKTVIIYMAERGFKLPDEASPEAGKYYRNAISQSAYRHVSPL